MFKLFEHLAEEDLGAVAELGVAEGNFSEDILNWPVNFPSVWLVDRWKHMPMMKGDSHSSQVWHDKNKARVLERIEKFGKRAQIVQRSTVDAASIFGDNFFSLVYVDADHSYHGCKADILAWWPKLKEGGVMAFHDFLNKGYGVRQAVEDFCRENRIICHLIPEDKEEDAGAWIRKC